MASDLESVFDVIAARNGLTAYKKGWPDRLCTDKQGNVFAVEVKGKDEPLRPHQYRLMSLLETIGMRVYVAPDGDATALVPLEEWLVSASNKGRPAQPGVVSRTTARSYGYKAKQLLNQVEIAERTPGFPPERIVELRTRAQSMMRKASLHWDGPDKDLVKDIVVMDRQSEVELTKMQVMFNEYEKMKHETEERDRLTALANEQLGGNDEGSK